MVISSSDTPGSPATTALRNWQRETPDWEVPGGVVDPLFTADGRYLLGRILTAPATYRLRALDVQTNAVVDFPFDFTPVVAHPVRADVFGWSAPGTVARIDVHGLHAVDGGCGPGRTRSFDLSADGDALLVLCDSADLRVLDARSGAITSTISLGAPGDVVAVVAGDRAGTAVVSRVRPAARAGFERVATTTGTVLSSFGPRLDPARPCGTAAVTGRSRDRRQIAVTCAFTPPGATTPVYRSDVLDVARRQWAATLAMDEDPIGLTFTDDGFVVYAAGVGPDGTGRLYELVASHGRPVIIVNDVTTHAMAIAFPPLEPRLTATVSGTTVQLSWTMPGSPPSSPVDDWVVEAWSDPEPRQIGSIAVRGEQGLILTGVPPGTYVVFVSGRNAAGLGRQSNVVTLTVPATP